MERWEGKVAVVTGSSVGIGAAISTYLVDNGMIVVGIARRENKLQELAEQLENKKGKFHALKVDITNEQEILDAFAWIEENLGGIHVLINNAGLLASCKVVAELETLKIKQAYDVNVVALTMLSKEAVKSMRAHNIDDGNIINISSYGAKMSSPLPGFAHYVGTKRAVQAISAGMRGELALENSNIRVTTICPGVVETEFFEAASLSLSSGTPHLTSEDIADVVIFCLKMKPAVHVVELTIRPTGEEYTKSFTE